MSTALWVLAGLATIASVVNKIVEWSQHETLREPPISQPGFFVGLGLVAMLGVLEVLLALHSWDRRQVVALTAVAGAILLDGLIASGAGSESAVPFFYSGLVGLLASAFALAGSPRAPYWGLLGLVGSIPLLTLVVLTSWFVGTVFP